MGKKGGQTRKGGAKRTERNEKKGPMKAPIYCKLNHYKTDFSHTLNCDPPIRHSFLIKVDDEEMDCSGAILSQHSVRLAKIVADNESLDLTPHFTGRADDMYSLLEILYGGKIEISMENMESFMKFGIMFQFPDFCDQVLEFLCREISVSNVIEMFDIGSNMKTLPDKPHNDRILEGCKGFIIGLEIIHISQLMLLLRKSVSRGDNVNPELVEFLLETAQSGPTIESHPLP